MKLTTAMVVCFRFQIPSDVRQLNIFRLLKMPMSPIFFAISAVAFVSIATHAAMALEDTSLKFLSVLTQLALLAVSINETYRSRQIIRWNIAFPLLSVLSVFPLISTILSMPLFDRKSITDGLILSSANFQLPIIAIATLAIVKRKRDDIELAILKFSRFALPLSVPLLFIGLALRSDPNFGISYLTFNNLLIPIALLLYIPFRNWFHWQGFCALAFMLISAALIGSRSYVLVSLYYLIGTVPLFLKSTASAKIQFVAFCIVVFLLVFWFRSDYSDQAGLEDFVAFEKFQLDSLTAAVNDAAMEGSIVPLFFWEGNSRSKILIDAFGDFTAVDWFLGKGVYATYKSFVTRSTIELGWAQETFRWGIIYTVVVIMIHIAVCRRLLHRGATTGSGAYRALAGLILIRVLDCFVYGMPTYDVYNFLVCFALMAPAVLPELGNSRQDGRTCA